MKQLFPEFLIDIYMGIRNSNGPRKGICRTEENMESVFFEALPEFFVPKRIERIAFVHKFRSREIISFVLIEE